MANNGDYSSALEMSLDEIIQRKKKLSRQQLRPSNLQRSGHQEGKRSSFPPGFDARQIIMQKQRSRITDAREIISRKRLHQELADLTIDEPKNKKQKTQSLGLRDDFFKRPLTTRNRRFAKSMGGHVKNLYVDYDDMSHLEAEQRMRLLVSKSTKKSSVSRSVTEELFEVSQDDDNEFCSNGAAKYHFQAQYLQPSAAPARSFRVLVSNLAGDVTSHDIKELFADIGPIVDASVIRQGTAEVFYKCLKDAEKAVFVYHNRYFDNKPMHCVLVPSPYAKRFVLTNGSRAAFNSNHPDAVDVDAVHHALFGDT
ncbi:uncharacterized protein LOC6648733 isoform X2 [Drosophila willistoni]|uniref:uncharacterized protein LOC6648733 isoform X2 n=1 Tax=Drosophila willistoni TaxID=7260 RepID=UPI000C26C39F|nr:uncharacterized protein LOC6648733 isoform X2 [Drosophila willistoni]